MLQKFVVVVLLFPGLFTTLARNQVAQKPEISELIHAAHDKGTFSGVVVLSQHGKVSLATQVGFSDKTRKTPMSPDTVFRLASLTKQITALLIMQEVEAGRIHLDQTAGELMKELPEASGRVTIKQLLQHVSGLANPSDGPDNVAPEFYQRKDKDAGDNRKSAMEFCSSKPKRDPGGIFEYNNCDYIVLGAILESMTGQSFAVLLKERITRPLGLRSWGVFPADPSSAPWVAIGYKEDGSPEDFQNPATYGAAGALYGNALDVALWNHALINHTLLSAESTNTMFRADPKLFGEALGSWAYDSSVTQPPVHIVERQGDIGGTLLLSLILPERDASLVIISNTERADLFNTYSKKGLGYEILKAWMGKPEPK
jgi:D-alanyl-D-alanine carboxypeptidase